MKVGAVVRMFRIISAGRAVWALASVSQATGWKPVQPNSVDEDIVQDALFLEDPDKDERNHHRGGDAGNVPGDAEELLAADLGVEHHGQDQRQPGLAEGHHGGVEHSIEDGGLEERDRSAPWRSCRSRSASARSAVADR